MQSKIARPYILARKSTSIFFPLKMKKHKHFFFFFKNIMEKVVTIQNKFTISEWEYPDKMTRNLSVVT